MKNTQNKIFWAVLFSEAGHIFCCVLPVLFSALSLLVGFGVVSAMPAGVVWFHDLMHGYEVPMIIVSGLILALGWGLYWYAKKVDCHDSGCEHEPCGTKKRSANKILIIASLLFAINVSVYFAFHRSVAPEITPHHHETDDHHH